MTRRSRAVVATLALLTGLCTLPSPASAGGHPHFNDQGTLVWYTNLGEAQAVARSTGKLIFVDSGRLECGNCRQLMERILPVEPIRSRIGAIAIGLSDDCDETDASVSALLNSNLPAANMLPLVGFLTPELRWVTGWSGGTTPGEVMRHLSIAEARYQRVQEVRNQRNSPCEAPSAPSARTAPPPTPAPAPRSAQLPVPVRPPPPSPAPFVTPAPPPSIAEAPAVRPAPPAPPAPPPAPPVIAQAPVARPTPPAALPETRIARAAPEPRPAPAARPQPSRTPVPSPVLRAEPPRVAVAAPPPPTRMPECAPTCAGSTMAAARAAAAGGHWGEVLQLASASRSSLSAADAAEMATLEQGACQWTLDSMASAEEAARERRYKDAERSLEIVRRELSDTTSPAWNDAQRGMVAIQRLVSIEQGSPDSADSPETQRKRAYSEFRGSRWAPLFRSRS